MKKIDYSNKNLKGDEQVFYMWEPLKFEIKDGYDFIKDNPFFKGISNIIFVIIAPILWVLNKVLFGFRIENKKNLKKVKYGKITISNHIHPMDCTMNGLVNFPKRTYYPTLASNFKIPLIRHIIRILYAIPIPEKRSHKEKFIEQIEQAIKKGKTIHMYPEGALWPYYEEIRDFKKGAFVMAVETESPIVPIVYQFEEPKGIYRLYKKKKCIYAKVLEPIYPDLKIDEKQRIEKLRKEALESMSY